MANGSQADADASRSWMGDVQRALALILVGTFAISVLAVTIRLVILSDPAALTDMAKTVQAALVNMSLVALGFFFGNTISKQRSDAASSNILDKLTPPSPPAGPAAPTVPVPPWWARLTDAEKTKITGEVTNDPRVQAFVTASQVGAATKDDLQYLVTKGLLTQDRADAIAAV